MMPLIFGLYINTNYTNGKARRADSSIVLRSISYCNNLYEHTKLANYDSH